MPWKESSVMEERLRFVARLLDGEAMLFAPHRELLRCSAVVRSVPMLSVMQVPK